MPRWSASMLIPSKGRKIQEETEGGDLDSISSWESRKETILSVKWNDKKRREAIKEKEDKRRRQVLKSQVSRIKRKTQRLSLSSLKTCDDLKEKVEKWFWNVCQTSLLGRNWLLVVSKCILSLSKKRHKCLTRKVEVWMTKRQEEKLGRRNAWLMLTLGSENFWDYEDRDWVILSPIFFSDTASVTGEQEVEKRLKTKGSFRSPVATSEERTVFLRRTQDKSKTATVFPGKTDCSSILPVVLLLWLKVFLMKRLLCEVSLPFLSKQTMCLASHRRCTRLNM